MADPEKTIERLRRQVAALQQRVTELEALEAARRRGKKTIRECAERHPLAACAGQLGVWDWNLETDEIYLDPNLKAMLGYHDHEVPNHLDGWKMLVHPEDVDRVMAEAAAHWQGQSPRYEVVHRLVHKDGSRRWCLSRGAAMRDGDGRPYRMVGANIDITEQRKLEQHVEARCLYLERILACAPDAIVTLDENHHILEWNPGAEALFGYTQDEVLGQDLDSLIVTAGSGRMEEAIALTQQTLSGEVVPPTETVRYRKDGRPVNVILAGAPIFAQDKVSGTVAVYTDITARKQAEEEIRHLEEFNESIVQNVAEGIALQDSEGRFTFINPAAASLLGYTPEELVGNDWQLIVPADQQPLVKAADARRLHGKADRYQVELLRRDGTRFPVQVSGSPRFHPDTGRFDGTLAVFTDISERVAAEAQLVRRAREMAALYETSLEINAQPDLSTLLLAIVRRASDLLGAEMGGLYLMRPGGEEVELVVGHNLPAHYIGTRLRLGEGLSGCVARTGEAMMVDDYEQWEGRAKVYNGYPFHRVLGVPLKLGERVIGVINITDVARTGLFEEEEVRLVSLFADQAAIAVENQRLFEAEARRRREAETLQAATQALSATLDLQQVFERILSELQHVVPYDSATVQQLKGNHLEIIGGYGYSNLKELLGIRFDVTAEDNPNREVVRTRRPLILDDAPALFSEFSREPHAQAGIRAWLGVPLLFGEKLIGMIALDKREAGFYSEDHARLALAFAAQAAIAIENARLFQAECEQRDLAEALQQAAAAVSSTLDLDQVLDQILEQMSRVIPGDSANIMLIDDGLARIVRLYAYDSDTDLARVQSTALRVADTPNLRQMQETAQAMVIPDTTTYAGWARPSRHVLSYAGAPIPVRDQVIGFLNSNNQTRNFFTEAHAERLQAFADQVGLAIGNAQLFRNVEAAKREWEATFDAMQDAVALVDHSRRIVRANRAFANLVQRDFSEIIGQECQAILGKMKCTGATCGIDQAQPDSRQGSCVHEQDGRLYQMLVMHLSEVQAESLAVIAQAIYIVRDITEGKRAEQEIQRRNQELALLNRIIAASAASHEIVPILEMVCRELAGLFRIPRSAATLLNEEKTEALVVAEFLAADRRPLLGQTISAAASPVLRHLLETSAPLVVDNARVDPHLALTHCLPPCRDTVSLLILPLIVEDQVVGSLELDAVELRTFAAEDIDLAQRVADQVSGALARARLAETQRRLSTAVEQLAEAVMIIDIDGCIVYANPAFERITGLDISGQVPHSPQRFHARDASLPFHGGVWRGTAGGATWQGRLSGTRPDGSSYTVDSTVAPVRNKTGEIVNYVGTLRDVTREEQLEEQFRQAQKMEALGRLAGGIAHDFNNLLTVMHLSTRLMQQQLRPEDPLWEHVKRIQETSDRAAKLTRQLLSFSRQEVIKPQIINLSRVVADLSRMLKRIIGEDVTMEMSLARDLWPLRADPTRMDQVIMNLVINARDAMPAGGKLTIETANVTLDQVSAAAEVNVEPGDYVMLAVSDTGVGIDDEAKSHLFEPFFTTKERGQGTGLGLSTVFGIVKQAKGDIRVDSHVGEGTTFRIYLPRAGTFRGTERESARPPLIAGLGHGTETVLVVEDESAVRELAVTVLKSCGYRVLSALNGPEALSLSEQHQGPIHLLITDMVMPHMNGRRLAERLQTLHPRLRVLYMSGYASSEVTENGALAPGADFLSKPFTIEELTHRVRAALDEAQQVQRTGELTMASG